MWLYAHSRVLHLSASLRSINREQRSWTKWRLLRSTNENRPVPSQMPVSWFEDVTTEIDSWTKLPFFFFFKVLETVAHARHSFPFKWEIPFWKVSVRLLKTSWHRDYSSKGHKLFCSWCLRFRLLICFNTMFLFPLIQLVCLYFVEYTKGWVRIKYCHRIGVKGYTVTLMSEKLFNQTSHSFLPRCINIFSPTPNHQIKQINSFFLFMGYKNPFHKKWQAPLKLWLFPLFVERKKFKEQGGFHKLMLERQEIHRKIHCAMSGGTVWYIRKHDGSSHQKGTGPITAIQLILNSNRQYDRHAHMAALHFASGNHLQNNVPLSCSSKSFITSFDRYEKSTVISRFFQHDWHQFSVW